jgi:hypothetical protein
VALRLRGLDDGLPPIENTNLLTSALGSHGRCNASLYRRRRTGHRSRHGTGNLPGAILRACSQGSDKTKTVITDYFDKAVDVDCRSSRSDCMGRGVVRAVGG